MPAIKRLLILGGTAEAAELAHRAVDAFAGRVEVISSLAGRLGTRRPLPGTVRVGGFGGVDGLTAYLRENAVDWVVDATHPFAETISANAYAACLRCDVQRLLVVRPPWRLPPGTRWIEVETLARAAEVLPRLARRAFLTVGAGGMTAFSGVAGVWFLVRLVEPPDDPLPLHDCEVVVGRPPFTVDGERALLEEHRIDTLVARQSGGGATAAKLMAARETGVKLVLIARPPPEPGLAVDGVEEAMAWLNNQV